MAIFSKNKPAPAAPSAPARSAETAFIGAKLCITGKISGSGNLIMMGKFEGEFDLAGEIVVAPSAVVSAEIKAAAVVVSGRVTGNLTATDKIHLEKSADVSGRMSAKRISITDGATFNGEVEMKKEASSKLEAGSASELKAQSSKLKGKEEKPVLAKER